MAKTTTINGAGRGSGSGSEAKAKTANGRKIKRLAQGFANEQPSRSGSPGLAEGRRWRRRGGLGTGDERQLAGGEAATLRGIFLFYAKCTKNIFKFISFFLK